MAIVELQNVSKQYKSLFALEQLSLTIQPGEILGLFGHNGAGKTTTIKLLLGVLKPTTGHVKVFDTDPADLNSHKLRKKIGFLQENVSFYQDMTGQELLDYFAKLKAISLKRSHSLLEQLGLSAAADRRIKTYSKGMRQRLGLAQALLGEPKLLLLDEPTVGLDPLATQEFYTNLKDLKDSGCTIIICSHILSGVEKLIDRALILNQGKAIASGNLKQLRQQATLPVTIQLFGENLILPPELNIPHTRTQFGIECQLSNQQKITSLHILSSIKGLKDIEIHMPSLDELYAYFNRKTKGIQVD